MTNEKLASAVLDPDLTAKRTIDKASEIIVAFCKEIKMPAWKREYDAIKQEMLDKYTAHKHEEADAVADAASAIHGLFFTDEKKEEAKASAGPSSMRRQSKIKTAY